MSSELSYANLGVEDWDNTRRFNEVIFNLKEHRDYLRAVMKRLQNNRYAFNYSVEQKGLVLNLPFDLDEASLKIGSMFLDRSGKNRLNAISYDHRRRTVIIEGPLPENNHIFYQNEGEAAPRRILFQPRITLNGIEPLVEKEEEINQALEFIFERSDEVRSKGNSKLGIAHIVDSDYRNGRIVIDKEPTSAVLEVGINTRSLMSQIKAIELLTINPMPHHKPLIHLLLSTRNNSWPAISEEDRASISYLKNSVDGFEEQRKFIDRSLNTPDLTILIGPPGSGKTATLIEFLIQCISRNMKVLMVASTHVAVDNILERISDGPYGERLMDKHGIVPLRIGRESVVSEKIGQFCLNRFCSEERRRIVTELSKLRERKDFQEELYNNLSMEQEGSSVIENMVLECANFICGTTLGILKAPMMVNDRSPLPHFDVLILDEASKTTFQEFLVPALYAKKWVLSGDPLQLAPYVEEQHVIECLRGFSDELGFDQTERQVCADVARCYNSSNSMRDCKEDACRVIVLEDGSDVLDLFRAQIAGTESYLECNSSQYGKAANGLGALILEGDEWKEHVREISVAGLIVTDRSTLPHILPFLHPTSVILGTKVSDQSLWRRSRWLDHDYDPYREPKQEMDWAGEVAWRIGRMYEVRDNEKKYSGYDFDVNVLLPRFGGLKEGGDEMEFSRKVRRSIDRVRRVSLPSILDLMIYGFEQERGGRSHNVALFNGLPERALEQRSVMLTYQHRMHPEISGFPHEHIYGGKALADDSDILEQRTWRFNRYAKRSMLIDVRPKRRDVGDRENFNEAEIEKMMGELEAVLKWTKLNTGPNQEPWSIALLSFYRRQEKMIAERIKTKFNLKGYRLFRMDGCNAEVQVSNVDRFQGHEADIVFLSFVRSKAHAKGIGFLDNRNRLNVAITRARYQLVVFADKDYMWKRGTPLLRDFIDGLAENIHFGRAD